jgi:hypothetical protein
MRTAVNFAAIAALALTALGATAAPAQAKGGAGWSKTVIPRGDAARPRLVLTGDAG